MGLEKVFYAYITFRPSTDWDNPQKIKDKVIAKNEKEAMKYFERAWYRNATIETVYERTG